MTQKKSFVLYQSYEETLAMLTDEEVGRLLRAIFVYNRTGEVLKMDRMVRMAFLFIKTQLDIDGEKYEKMKQSRAEAGRKGAKARWDDGKNGKATTKMASDSKAMANDSTAINEMANMAVDDNVDDDVDDNVDDDVVSLLVTDGDRDRDAKSDYSDDFLEFWKLYPNKSGKRRAFNEWQKIDPDAETQRRMLEALSAQKKGRQWQQEQGRFVPRGSSWLSERRWEDEPPPPWSPRAKVEHFQEFAKERDLSYLEE